MKTNANKKFKIFRKVGRLCGADQNLLEMTMANYNGACDHANRKDINSSINLCKIKSK